MARLVNLLSNEISEATFADDGTLLAVTTIEEGGGNLLGGENAEFVGLKPMYGAFSLQDICGRADDDGGCACSCLCSNRGVVACVE